MDETKLTHIVGTTSGVIGAFSFGMIFVSTNIIATVLFGVSAFLALTMFKNYVAMWASVGSTNIVPMTIPLPGGEEVVIQNVEDKVEVRAALEMLDNDMLEVLVNAMEYLIEEDPTYRCGVVNEVLVEVIADRGEEFFNEE